MKPGNKACAVAFAAVFGIILMVTDMSNANLTSGPNRAVRSDVRMSRGREGMRRVGSSLNPMSKTREGLRARSEILTPNPADSRDDMVGRLAEVEREKMVSELREKFACAQASLDKLKSKLSTITDLKAHIKRGKPAAGKDSAARIAAQKQLKSTMDLEGIASGPNFEFSCIPGESPKKISPTKHEKCHGMIICISFVTYTVGLREHWYPVEFISKLDVGKSREIEIFDTKYTVTHVSQGKYVCRSSTGEILPISTKDGLIWAYPGENDLPEVPGHTMPPEGYQIHAELEMEVPVEHGLLMENLLDLAHAPFTHTSTFAKGWSVPDSVKFHASKMLSGHWDPYPIEMAFDIPCMVNSKIGLVKVGKAAINLKADQCSNHLHQLHVCIPTGRGKTRLLYRMSLDMEGLHWTRGMPGVDMLWKSIAEQVLSEDTSLVMGQQDRMERGANTWLHPVSYDKLGVRYRRWRNSLDSGDEKEKLAAEKAVKEKMSAGELFYIDDEEIQSSSF